MHLDDLKVASFASAMTAKMAKSRSKGRGGWENCPVPELWQMLREHVEKGDPVDVANFAMMIWHNSQTPQKVDADAPPGLEQIISREQTIPRNLYDYIALNQGQAKSPLGSGDVASLNPSFLSPPRAEVTLQDGSPVTPDHRDLQEDGQQKAYVVLSKEERAKGFRRPVRRSYVHVGENPETRGIVLIRADRASGGCGALTKMGQALAETYACDPGFYSHTFCVGCRAHYPLDQFMWEGSTERVGS